MFQSKINWNFRQKFDQNFDNKKSLLFIYAACTDSVRFSNIFLFNSPFFLAC